MKKLVTGIMALIIGVGACLTLTSCDLKPEQVKVIAQNAGLYSAVIWISVDNPDASTMAAVSGILDVIIEKASEVQTGKTYTEVLYPEVMKVIETTVEDKDKPLCKAATLSILNGLDTLFAMYPEWKESESVAISVVNSFILGAKNGLALGEKHPVMIQARKTAVARKAIAL